MTERGTYRFVVKEGESGKLFLALEPAGGTLALLRHGLMTFDLTKGMTMDEAHALARILNDQVPSIAYTSF